ncbi:uncharacterized protein LOC122260695 [Penaeus japonicus]|uniref:uncharacterized protein LOC122260695 n=1 Tax=Penaeus japonicus TaxID=27405 RepID=UPI001C713F13|nr:uncharacterized protein LOC122260695 [Penaeus japonicus]
MCIMVFFRTSCVDCTTRSLSLGVGLIGAIISVIFIALTSFMLHAKINEDFEQSFLPVTDKTGVVIASLTLSLLAMPCSVVLIIGVCKEQRVLVLSWLYLLSLTLARDITTIFFALTSARHSIYVGLFLFEIWFCVLGFFIVRAYGSSLSVYSSSRNQRPNPIAEGSMV